MFLTYKIDDDIKLRFPLITDAKELAALINETGTTLSDWIPWANAEFSEADAREYIEQINRFRADNLGFWTFIVYRGKIAGGVGLNRFDYQNHLTEMGYWLADKYQGKGIAMKACSAFVEYVFDDLFFNRIELRSQPKNARSLRLAEKLGFKYEGAARQAEWICGGYADLSLYSLLKSDRILKPV